MQKNVKRSGLIIGTVFFCEQNSAYYNCNVKNYIQTHYIHKDGACLAMNIYKGQYADCIVASGFIGDFAKDAGTVSQYGSTLTGQHYHDGA